MDNQLSPPCHEVYSYHGNDFVKILLILVALKRPSPSIVRPWKAVCKATSGSTQADPQPLKARETRNSACVGHLQLSTIANPPQHGFDRGIPPGGSTKAEIHRRGRGGSVASAAARPSHCRRRPDRREPNRPQASRPATVRTAIRMATARAGRLWRWRRIPRDSHCPVPLGYGQEERDGEQRVGRPG